MSFLCDTIIFMIQSYYFIINQDCSENEEYYRCDLLVCNKTCDDLKNPPACPAVKSCLKPGCVCKKGFLRNAEHKCVPIEECFLTVVSAVPPVVTPEDCASRENEVYSKCDLEVCYKTCNHLKSPPPCPSIAAGCFKPSCVCKEDFLRNANDKCVPINKCD